MSRRMLSWIIQSLTDLWMIDNTDTVLTHDTQTTLTATTVLPHRATGPFSL